MRVSKEGYGVWVRMVLQINERDTVDTIDCMPSLL